MKFLLITAVFAVIGLATAAQLPDSATQGPNPQDIATPEPEYIDIDLPEPAHAAASAPAPAPQPIQHFAAAPRPIARPVSFAAPAPAYHAPVQSIQYAQQRAQYLPPFAAQATQQVAGHSFNSQSGYQYRRPVYVRRFYRHRRY